MHNRPVVPGRAQLQRCRDDTQFWRNYALLYRYAVRVDRAAEMVALVTSRIPTQRQPVELWPARRPVPVGSPPHPRIQPRPMR